MSMVFRAADQPEKGRPDYWRHVINDEFLQMDIRFDDGPSSHDQIITGVLGAVRVTESTSCAGEVRRTSKHISSSEPHSYQLVAQAWGSVVGEQDNRQVELSAGDLCLIDPSRPLRCAHRPRRSVFVNFPPTLTRLGAREMAQLVCTRIPGHRGSGALVSTLVRQLPRHLDDEDGGSEAMLGTAVLDLLTVLFAARLGQSSRVPPPARQNALLTSVQAFIDARLSDPGLTPASIAAAHHISLRYLHKLFETQPRTVADLIRQRRLDHCRQDLLDPALAGRPVSAMAARWGFTSAAHFSRLFRDAYGLPPGEFRLAHAAPQTAPETARVTVPETAREAAGR